MHVFSAFFLQKDTNNESNDTQDYKDDPLSVINISNDVN